jgi:hypothetical protein
MRRIQFHQTEAHVRGRNVKDYEIQTSKGKVKVKALGRAKDYGYHYRWRGSPLYVVTHIPSGIKIKEYQDPRKAEVIIQWLAREMPQTGKPLSTADKRQLISLFQNNLLVTYFPSALRNVSEIMGFAGKNQNLGITVGKCGGNCLKALKSLASDPTFHGTVFVDSGAFSEVKGKPPNWKKVFKVYDELADLYGSRLYIVAPDKIGDQEETYRRIYTYVHQLKRLYDKGANIIVALQGQNLDPEDAKDRWLELGSYSLVEYEKLITQLFNQVRIDNFVRGIPVTVKSPYDLWDVQELLTNAPQFQRLHLLGKSPIAPDWEEWESMLIKFPWLDVTLDAARVPALVGKGKSRIEKLGYTGRALTAEQAYHRDQLRGEIKGTAEGIDPEGVMTGVDYTEMIGSPSLWLDDDPKLKRLVFDTIYADHSYDLPPREWLEDHLDEWLQHPYSYQEDMNALLANNAFPSWADVEALEAEQPDYYWNQILQEGQKYEGDTDRWHEVLFPVLKDAYETYAMTLFRAEPTRRAIGSLTRRERGLTGIAMNPRKRR